MFVNCCPRKLPGVFHLKETAAGWQEILVSSLCRVEPRLQITAVNSVRQARVNSFSYQDITRASKDDRRTHEQQQQTEQSEARGYMVRSLQPRSN
jgi:hypothetical protein